MEKLDKKTLNQAFLHYYFGLASNQTFSQLQTLGYMWTMLPVIQKLYEDRGTQKDRLLVYSDVFNTEPQIGAGIAGITIRLEEDRAEGGDVSDDDIRDVRSGLAGSLAGIGDSMIVGTFIPLLLAIAIDVSVYGSSYGILLYLVLWIGTCTLAQRWFFNRGYEMRDRAVDILVDGKAQAVRHACLTAAIIAFGTIGGKFINVQSTPFIQNRLNVVFPNFLTFFFILLVWWLLAKKKMTPRNVMLILALATVVCSLLGILTPSFAA
ncbi:MAG: PTS system mannose/fructose/sorbose family transporter subunit IID [Erysipelotrichia bacterium]|nr:PTS system mannose/fructose/sorbose family transporter subunit IID [Erysipelotrichia bacterium]